MKICLFGASSENLDAKWTEAVAAFAQELGRRGHTLVFGASGTGLMRTAADYALAGGSPAVIGVVPEFIRERYAPAASCTEIITTETMAQRKATMIGLADAFVAVPGGVGTLDELFEVAVLRHLGQAEQKLALFNPYGFYDGVMESLRGMERAGFLNRPLDGLLRCFAEAGPLLDWLEA